MVSKEGSNPLTTDDKLKEMLAGAENLTSDSEFITWRKSFLKVFEKYLDPDGVANARDAEGRLIVKLQALTKIVLKVKTLTTNGNIAKAKVTAEGWKGLGDMNTAIHSVEQGLANFVPKTWAHEEKVGYDKYELAAVLIKDGFRANEIMMATRDYILTLRAGPLNGIIDKNSTRFIEFYEREIHVFVDVMADLGIMKLVKSCLDIYKKAPRKSRKSKAKSTPVPSVEKEVKVPEKGGSTPGKPGSKTAGKAAPPPKKQGGKGAAGANKPPPSGAEEEEEPEAKEDEEDDGEGGEGDAGPDIIYFDPKTGQIGKVPRALCIANDIIVTTDEAGEETNAGVIEDPSEKSHLNWELKKVEKKKPKGNWLDEIKAEKAAKKAAENGGEVPKPIAKSSGHKSASKSKKVPKPSTSSQGKKPSSSSAAPLKTASEHNAAMDASEAAAEAAATNSNSNSPNVQAKRLADFDGIYKTTSAKPSSSGWSTVKPETVELNPKSK